MQLIAEVQREDSSVLYTFKALHGLKGHQPWGYCSGKYENLVLGLG